MANAIWNVCHSVLLHWPIRALNTIGTLLAKAVAIGYGTKIKFKGTKFK